MEDNQINDSLQVNSGRRIDWRQNNWPSVDAAETAITGTQRISGMLIPVEISAGLVIQHHFVNGSLVPYDGRINQSDAVLVDGFSLNGPKTEATLQGTQWRINDIVRTIPNNITYPIPAPDAGGLIRIDRIKLDASGPSYMVGEPGISAAAPALIYGEIVLRDITVSLADVQSDPEPIPANDGETVYRLTNPTDADGKVGDVWIIKQSGPDYGKAYKKYLGGWVLEYTPTAGGGDTTGLATVEYVDEQDAAIVNQIVSTADVDYNTLKKIQDKFAAILVLLNGDDINLDQIKELADAIKADAANIAALTTGKVNVTDIYNALDYVLAGKVLDARQGKVLNDAITTLSGLLGGKQNTSEKDASGGYAGLTLFKINFKNALNTITSFFTNANTAARTYTFPDKSGTVAMMDDLTGLGGGGAAIDDATPAADKVYSSNKVESKFLTQSGLKVYAVASGINTYTANLTPAISAYANGQKFLVKFINANTGPSTINFNAVGDLTLVKNGSVQVLSNDIQANQLYIVAVDGSNCQILGSVNNIPTVASGEKVLTVTVTGVQKTYDIIDPFTGPTSVAALDAANWSTGSVTATGTQGEERYGTNYHYRCSGTNVWRRTHINLVVNDYSLGDVADSGGVKTSAQMVALFPAAIVPQIAFGVNGIYTYAGIKGWFYSANTITP